MGKLAEKRLHRYAQPNLSAYLDGELSEKEAARIRAHLERCEACRQDVAALQATIRALASMPRAPLPRSFTLSPQAVRGQQRLRRLDMGFAALRAVGVAVTVAFVLLLSGDQLLARDIVSLPAARAPQESYDVAPLAAREIEPAAADARTEAQPEALVEPEALAQVQVEAEVAALSMAETPAEPEAEVETKIVPPMAAPEEPTPAPTEPLLAAIVEPDPTVQQPLVAPQPAATKAPPETLTEAEQTRVARTPLAPPLDRTPDAETAAADAPTQPGDEPAALAVTPEAPTPDIAPTATPVATSPPPPPPPPTAPAPEPSPTASPVIAAPTQAPVATVAAPTEEAVTLAMAPAEQEAPPEQEIALGPTPGEEELVKPITPDELAAARAADPRVIPPPATPERVALERMEAPPPGDAVAAVRAILRQALAVLAGVALMVLGGLLWVGYKRRL